MNRFVSTALGLAVSSVLLAPSALAQTQIGGVTLTPIKPGAAAPATTTDEYDRESIPKGYREVRGRITGPSEGLRLPDAPPAASLRDAEATLRSLDAIAQDGRITASGRLLASLPVEPRWGGPCWAARGGWVPRRPPQRWHWLPPMCAPRERI